LNFLKWSGLKESFSKLANNPFFHNYKKQMAVLMVLIIFLAAGMAEPIGAAVIPDKGQAADLIPAYKVSMGGTELGYVSDPAAAQAVVDQMLQDAARQYGMDVSVKQELAFQEVSVAPGRLSLADDMVQAVRQSIQINANAYTLYADDTAIGILRSRQDADKLLNTIKAQYVNDASKFEGVAFQEEIRILFTPVPFDKVQDLNAVAAEIAKGRDTVEEYTIVEGDTLWSIARAHDMHINELTAMNSDIQDLDKLKLGQKLRLSYPKSPLNVVTTELAQYEQEITFQTETREDGSMYKNQTKVLQEGKAGLKKVEARIRKVNGVEQGREILSEQVVQEPVVKIVAKGTKTVAAMASRGGGALLWPTRGTVSSSFGRRWGRSHNGVDIANSIGTPVYAAEPGKVIFSGRSSGYGNLIKISHGGGLVTYYGHLNSRAVSSGQSVDRGQLIGYMGNTGNSTGPHLHFEVRVNDSPKNPMKYLP
jgi:murein DD-endopeptidase MepM/ murein hydrolase activator NlpD